MSARESHNWLKAISDFLQLVRAENGDDMRSIGELLAQLGSAIDAQCCALLSLQDENVICIATSEAGCLPDLAGLDGSMLWAGAAAPDGIFPFSIRGIQDAVKPLALVVCKTAPCALDDEDVAKVQDVVALLDMTCARQAEMRRSKVLSSLKDAAVLDNLAVQSWDTGARDQLGAALHKLTQAQALSVELIDDLLAATPEHLDSVIDTALMRMGQFCGCDRTYVFQETGVNLISNIYEWCAEGIEPVKDLLQDVPAEVADPWWQGFRTDGHVYIPDILALPEGAALRQTLEEQGIKSLLAVPLQHQGRVVGFVGYDAVRQKRSFLLGEIHLIKSVANMIATLLIRRKTDTEVEEARRQKEVEREKLRATLSVLPDVLLEFDQNLRVTGFHVNNRMNLPITLDSLVGSPLQAYFPAHVGALAEQIRKDLETADLATGYQCSLEMGGKQYWYSVSAARRPPDVKGKNGGYIAVVRDITESHLQRIEIERLGQIAMNSTNLIIITDAQGLIEWVNPAFERRTGYGLHEILGRKPGEFLQSPLTDRNTIAKIRKAIAAECAITCEILNRTKSGELYWIEIAIQPIFGESGDLTGFMSVQTDLTEHRIHARNLELALKAEQAARAQLRSAVSIMQDAFIQYDADQKMVLCNDRYRDLFSELRPVLVPGNSLSEILAAGVECGCFAQDVADPQAWISAQLQGFHLKYTESNVQNRAGRWYRQIQQPTPDGGRIAILSDITDLKDAEQRALSDRARAMDASRDGIALLTEDGIVTYANGAAAQIFQQSAPDLVLGHFWRDMIQGKPGEPLDKVAIPAFARQGFWKGQALAKRQDGTLCDVEISATRSSDGGILCILQDITEKLHIEAEQERLREELALARRREEVGQIAAGLTHDFNNLLAAISGAASLIEETGAGDSRALAENIGSAVEQASGLVRRMMALGKKKLEKDLVDLSIPVRDAVDLVRAGLRPPVQLQLSLPPRPVMCLADQTAVMQTVLNLCINARDAVASQDAQDPPGLITVCISDPEPGDAGRVFDIGGWQDRLEYVRITVSDNGPGMDAKTRENIFTPYFSTKGERGTGLGLPIVVGAVRDHGGALAVETAPGQGTVFTILWPLAKPDDLREPIAKRGHLHGFSFLVVGTDPPNLRELTGLLERAGGLAVPCDRAEDAEEFLTAELDGWDMVLLDSAMGHCAMDKVIAVARRVRADLPVVVLRAHPEAADEISNASLVLDMPRNKSEITLDILHLLKK
ncbi:PAS domain-containing protein [Roseinatronobacter sp. NSM]|uniref:PAS domain-containing protein n=1 Tax=Roseinatronobacter sp. NSM TaxID=3457785 RepID=UPI0040364D36